MTGQPKLYSFANVDALAPALRSYILQAQAAALQRHDAFRVAVSGGSLPATLAKALLAPDQGTADAVAWDKWDIWFADERAVPLDHPDSNYGLVKKDLLDHIPSSQGKPTVHPIDVSVLPAPGSQAEPDVTELADRYQDDILNVFAAKDSVRLPLFDLILLGCGPDGHTCSLFPGHALLRENDAWVAGIRDSPKPPPHRTTLTLPVVTHAVRIAFVATGAGKQDVLRQIFDGEERGESLPCGLVNKGGGDRVCWFTDDAAVHGVQYPRRGSL